MGSIADWLLSRSDAFRIFLNKFKLHKKNTENSFKKVKRDNILMVKKLREHEDKISELNGTIQELMVEREEPVRVYKKNKA